MLIWQKFWRHLFLAEELLHLDGAHVQFAVILFLLEPIDKGVVEKVNILVVFHHLVLIAAEQLTCKPLGEERWSVLSLDLFFLIIIKILLVVGNILLDHLLGVLNWLVRVFLYHWVSDLHSGNTILVVEFSLFLTIVIVNLVVYLNVHYLIF